MKKNILVLPAFVFAFAVSCNNSDNKNSNTGNSEKTKTRADSLMDDVSDGHDFGMAKMGKLNTMQKNVQRVLDSIAKLPVKSKTVMEPYIAKMNTVLEELKAAKSGMNQWMEEFNPDSAVNNMEQRIKYLSEEKLKISSVKESILQGLQKADSLLKAKF
jgi:hypothetical protein